MDTPTYASILSNLPLLLMTWTALTMSWGIYIASTYRRMIAYADQHKGGHRPCDYTNRKFMLGINIVFAAYLAFEPLVVPFAGDAILVLNVFYTAYLIPCTIATVRWQFFKHRKHTQSDQALTQ